MDSYRCHHATLIQTVGVDSTQYPQNPTLDRSLFTCHQSRSRWRRKASGYLESNMSSVSCSAVTPSSRTFQPVSVSAFSSSNFTGTEYWVPFASNAIFMSTFQVSLPMVSNPRGWVVTVVTPCFA